MLIARSKSKSPFVPSAGAVLADWGADVVKIEHPVIKELERENQRLKKFVTEQALDIDMLKEISRGNL